MSRAKRLREYCEAVQGIQATRGISDCTTWPAQWVESETGRKINVPTYRSKAEADAIIHAAGGVPQLWQQFLDFLPQGEPTLGDVGIVRLRTLGDVGVIFLNFGTCAWRTGTGFKVFSPNPNYIIRAWNLP